MQEATNRQRIFPSPLYPAIAGVVGMAIGYAIAPNSTYALLPGLILLAVSLLGYFPHLGLYAIVFVFPFGAYRGKIHWILGAALLIVACLHYLPRKQWPARLRSNLWPWMIALIAVSFVSACWSPYPGPAFRDLALLIAGASFVALCLLMISPRSFRDTLPLITVISVTLGSLLAVVGYIYDVPLFAANVERFKRGFGATVSPNSMAIFIVSAIPFLLYYLFKVRKAGLYLLVVLALVVNLAAIITTYSRGGFWIMLVIVAISLVEFRRHWNIRHAGIVTLCAGFYLVLPSLIDPDSQWYQGSAETAHVEQVQRNPLSSQERKLPPGKDPTPKTNLDYWERQQSLSRSGDFSVNRRWTYLHVGWEAFLKRPVIGFGPMTFKYIYRDSPRAQQVMKQSGRKNQRVSARVAHNTYLEVLVGSGIVGLVCFLGLIGTALWNLSRAKGRALLRGNPQETLLLAAYRLSFVSMLLYFFIQTMVNHKPFLLFLAISQAALWMTQDREIEMGEELGRIY